MNLPLFSPDKDPGPSFINLLNLQNLPGISAFNAADSRGVINSGTALNPVLGMSSGTATDRLVHATTVVGAKWKDGVIMAGDRRATTGSLISHRSMEKVFPADSHSGVAIAGVAGPSIEMVKLFQLQLEHYEKLEDKPLSLEGKANQLTHFVRNNLPAAMQGMVVVPIFAGYDQNRNEGRLFNYDITGGRYEEQEYVAVGSGSLHASTVIKLEHRPDMSRNEAIDLMLTALFQAADEDTGTGGPDPLRGIYPTAAVITADGYETLPESKISERFNQLNQKV